MSFAELNRMGVTCRPISSWPGVMTRNRKRSPFRASWGKTVADLATELKHVGARRIMIEMALQEHEITIDGSRPRANASPSHPGVVLSFESKNGPLRFAADASINSKRGYSWESNPWVWAVTFKLLEAKS